MSQMNRIKIPEQPETARAVGDIRRRRAVSRLIDRMVRPTRQDDPLATILETTARQARRLGLTDVEISAELAAYNAERRRL